MDVFSALADPTRRRIVELVCAADMSAGEIAEQFKGMKELAGVAVAQQGSRF